MLFKKFIHKSIAAIASDPSGGSGKTQLKTFWKGFIILYAIKNICDSWEEVKRATIRSLEEEFVLTVLDDTEGVKDSVKQGTADVLELTRELELDVEPENVSELLPSQDKS